MVLAHALMATACPMTGLQNPSAAQRQRQSSVWSTPEKLWVVDEDDVSPGPGFAAVLTFAVCRVSDPRKLPACILHF